jgi:hypothetical protein
MEFHILQHDEGMKGKKDSIIFSPRFVRWKHPNPSSTLEKQLIGFEVIMDSWPPMI